MLQHFGGPSTKRLPSLPDVPTVAELVPGFEVLSWQAIFARAEVPTAVAQRLHKEVTAILRTSDMRARLDQLGMLPADMSVEQIRAFQISEVQRWAQVVKTANLHI